MDKKLLDALNVIKAKCKHHIDAYNDCNGCTWYSERHAEFGCRLAKHPAEWEIDDLKE